MDKICNGVFSKNCTRTVFEKFDLCSDCNKIRLEKINAGICSASLDCKYPANGKHPWCKWCHISKLLKNIFEGHDCSSRGGVACSTCDGLYSMVLKKHH